MTEMTVEFSRPFAIDSLTRSGNSVTHSANKQERAALAERLGVNAIEVFEIRYDIRAEEGVSANDTAIVVSGALTATVNQACVVTLEAVENRIESTFKRRFVSDARIDAEPCEELDLDVADEDPPEPVENGTIDLGEIASEQLALEIDPFPRAEGATFGGYSSDASEETPPHPFAALADLKAKLNKRDGEA